jgi:Domain of unknown function (DUF4129)
MNPRDIAPEIAAVAGNYKYKKPPDLLLQVQEWLDKAWRFLTDLFSSLRLHMPGMADTNMVGNIMQMLVLLVGALCLFVIVYFALKRMGHLSAQAKLAKKGQSAAYRLLDAAGWKEEAKQLAEKKDWREACRALYMSSLRAMHENAVIEFAPTRTNYEYWYALAPRSEMLAFTFRSLANQVELIWFGNKQASEEDYRSITEYLQKVEEECQSVRETTAREIASRS